MTSDDRPRRSEQRYSRYSRMSYDEVLPPQPPEEPSFAEIAARALNRPHALQQTPRPVNGRSPAPGGQRWDQPPPPEPEPASWSQEDYEQLSPPPLQPRQARAPQPPRQPERWPDEEPYSGQEPPPDYAEETPFAEPARRKPKILSRGRLKAEPEREARPAEPRKPGAFVRALQGARSKAGPALASGAFWLANNLRRREIRKRYNRALVFCHAKVLDRKLEELFFVPTRLDERIDPAPERGIHYDGPVPSAVFSWIMAMMPADLRQFAFIDVHAGRGRTALLASKWNFNRILAYEYDPKIFDDLQMNIAQYPRSRMVCRNVDCYRGDIDGIRLPDQPCVIYFSSAWREKMIPGVMDYVRSTYRQSPRRIYVVFENVDQETALAGDGVFERIEPQLSERLKLRLLSPMDFRLYRSLV